MGSAKPCWKLSPWSLLLQQQSNGVGGGGNGGGNGGGGNGGKCGDPKQVFWKSAAKRRRVSWSIVCGVMLFGLGLISLFTGHVASDLEWWNSQRLVKRSLYSKLDVRDNDVEDRSQQRRNEQIQSSQSKLTGERC